METAYTDPVTGFTKLFSTIIHSTVWREDMHVKVVWVTLLAMADRNGRIWASVPGLADASRVSLPQCREALAKLSGPDPDSRTKTNEGRRIKEIDGGWELLNYLKYREMRSEDERRLQTRAAVRRFRQKKAEQLTVSLSKPEKAQAEEEAERENVGTEGKPLPPFLPAADRTEKAIRDSTEGLRSELYGLIDEMVGKDPEQRDPTQLMRLVTSYEKNGKTIGGVVNAGLLTFERLEKSIADARWHLSEWGKNGPKPSATH